jgi:hypothetical protein
MPMNIVHIKSCNGSKRIEQLRPGVVFCTLKPFDPDNLYMTTDNFATSGKAIKCIHLNKGTAYEFSVDKEVQPLPAGSSVEINVNTESLYNF